MSRKTPRDPQCFCCRRCSCRLWCADRWGPVQPWRSLVLLSPEGLFLGYGQKPNIAENSGFVRLCGRGNQSSIGLIFRHNCGVHFHFHFSFFCAMIAAITLKFLDPFGTGKLVLFQVTYDKVRDSILGCNYSRGTNLSCTEGLARLWTSALLTSRRLWGTTITYTTRTI